MHCFDYKDDRWLGDSRFPAFEAIDPWLVMVREIAENAPVIARFSAQELRARWLDNAAAIAVADHHILSYTSLIPIEAGSVPFNVLEASSGWTHPMIRRQGIQVTLRRHLYHDFSSALLLSYCVGVGASLVLKKLGWRLVGWDDYPNVSELVGHISGKHLVHRLGDRVDLGSRIPYNGSLDSGDAAGMHSWDSYLHLWVSDLARAKTAQMRNG